MTQYLQTTFSVAAAIVVAAAVLVGAPAVSEQADPGILIVQQAEAATFDGEFLTLENVRATVWFSDRPQRLTGRLTAAELVSAWTADGAFASELPNAAISFSGGQSEDTVIAILNGLQMSGDSVFRYEITVIEGVLPPSMEHVALFIDPAGPGDGTEGFF